MWAKIITLACVTMRWRKLTWKITTRPPLSPVASRSPSWLNSTHDMTSASVISSFSAPLTCEKHQLVSPWPGKVNVEWRINYCVVDGKDPAGCKHNHEMSPSSVERRFVCHELIPDGHTHKTGPSKGGKQREFIKSTHKPVIVWPWGIFFIALLELR